MSKVSDLHRKWMQNREYRDAHQALTPEFELARANAETPLGSGVDAGAADAILHVLRCSESDSRTGAEFVAAMQASPCKDVSLEPSRESLPVRDSAFWKT